MSRDCGGSQNVRRAESSSSDAPGISLARPVYQRSDVYVMSLVCAPETGKRGQKLVVLPRLAHGPHRASQAVARIVKCAGNYVPMPGCMADAHPRGEAQKRHFRSGPLRASDRLCTWSRNVSACSLPQGLNMEDTPMEHGEKSTESLQMPSPPKIKVNRQLASVKAQVVPWRVAGCRSAGPAQLQ